MEKTDDLIDFSDNNSDSEYETETYTERPPTPPRIVLKAIDFEEYVKENYEDKIKILNRKTFQQISKPIIIVFNHFREKCAYHTKILDTVHQLALKYGERIEFIAADMFDIDLLKFKRIALDFFYGDVSPEKVNAFIFAIDQQKRVHELHYADEQSVESLTNLCEDLLNDRLFKSQPLPEPDSSRLVKICVHDNYHELVTNSTKHILLIVNHTDYTEIKPDEGPNYEMVAEHLKPYNVDVVYINGDQNYIPYELGITCYTTLVLIPQDDKTNFICHPTGGDSIEENIINTVKMYIEDRKAFEELKEKERSTNWYYPLKITTDFNLDIKELPQYLKEKCGDCLKVFQRSELENIQNDCNILIFMDFRNDKCLTHHLKWIDQVYQVAMNLEGINYFIADYKDIDVINTEWKSENFKENITPESMVPRVFGIDQNKNKFQMKDFKNPATLFYFGYGLCKGELEEEYNISV
ncbi:hypothetical protein FF38_12963 [Lucilia cuprina]|uniref:Thioredoxin domain-containing protein n=1 Tax=Lucilia cuprina TaxID=7375 RepID=A0A0L0C283_LUCCU|nr:Protein disulfide-isomerase 2 [Lucilia cuprina]KNC25539.1 hypothetical protein FF38_12963 [Lucilia cuprina]